MSNIDDWLDNEKADISNKDDNNIMNLLKGCALKWYEDNYTINKKTKTYHLSRDKKSYKAYTLINKSSGISQPPYNSIYPKTMAYSGI